MESDWFDRTPHTASQQPSERLPECTLHARLCDPHTVGGGRCVGVWMHAGGNQDGAGVCAGAHADASDGWIYWFDQTVPMHAVMFAKLRCG